MEAKPTKRQKLAFRLKRRVLTGQYTRKLPSERELAKELGLSRGTVNMAVTELVSQGILERRPGLGTFVVEGLAPGQPGRSYAGRMLHVIFHDRPRLWGGRVWSGQILHALDQATRPLGILLAYHTVMRDAESLGDTLAKLYLNEAAIGICVADGMDARTVFRLMDTGLPFALIDWRLADLRVNSVVFDDFTGGTLAAEHLLELGHRRFALVGPWSDNTTKIKDRREGFEQTLRAQDIAPPPECFVPRDNAGEPELRKLRQFLQARRPTALFCPEDKAAAATLLALKALRIDVPERVSVVGFGDEVLGLAEMIELTTVGGDMHMLGRECIGLLLDEFALTRPKHVVIPVQLVKRASTAPPPSTPS